MNELKKVEVPISGMDCAECSHGVQRAIEKVPGVHSVDVYLGAEKARIQLNPALVDLTQIRNAVEAAGYTVPEKDEEASSSDRSYGDFTRRIGTFLAVVFGLVLFVVVVGEWLGVFDKLIEQVPFEIGVLIVLLSGYSIFRNVFKSGLKRQITSHTLMTLGVLAALVVGEWATAAVVVFFMRVGDYVESFTAEGARRAVKDLSALMPQIARLKVEGEEVEVSISKVKRGDLVIVRPGEKIPVDGDVISGQATVNQAAITGESMAVDVSEGSQVFAASMVRLGSIQVRTNRVGRDTVFGRVIQMVEEAEENRSEVQRFADKFTGFYLPVVAGVAALTYLISRNPLATAAVLVVACSCSIALATPIAMLASIGGAAKKGLLIKGGKYLETLAQANVLLIDKTGTITLGQPKLTGVYPINGMPKNEILSLAASAERFSEHPLAEAVRDAAREWGVMLMEPDEFEAVPGKGVRAKIEDTRLIVGNQLLVSGTRDHHLVNELEAQGKTLLFLSRDGEFVGILAAEDTLRSEVPEAIESLHKLGVEHIELLTGDNELSTSALASQIGIRYRAKMLPEDKTTVVKDFQAHGYKVVMVGDGVNDAPALAQADVGIAMGAAGTDIAIEAAHIALMREDWTLIPEVFRIAQQTMGVVKMNLIFTAIYNLAGLSLAAFGFLPPVLAAAAQSLPDLGILANSSRLLKQN